MRLIFFILLIIPWSHLQSQVKIRLFADKKPESVIFTPRTGKYVLDFFAGDTIHITIGKPVIIALFNGKLAVKERNKPGFTADSVQFTALSPENTFSLRINGASTVRQYYSGNLECLPDLGTIVMINNCNEEEYIAGVVRAEGGTGRHIEYFKTQAVIARTYMYRYLKKHMDDGYNLCDNTHCQAFNGLCTDTFINQATSETKGQVIVDSDSMLIISAFHSNCGGETSSSADVWLADVPYLQSIKDPWCSGKRNSSWQKTYSGDEWLNMISRVGHTVKPVQLQDIRFIQNTRVADYRAGNVRIPLRDIRSELNLRSTYFSVLPEGSNVVLKGKGYGHGVGLCQEGAMAMAADGFTYNQIISFYYTGVRISQVGKAVSAPVIIK